jgi:hypothetical protein
VGGAADRASPDHADGLRGTRCGSSRLINRRSWVQIYLGKGPQTQAFPFQERQARRSLRASIRIDGDDIIPDAVLDSYGGWRPLAEASAGAADIDIANIIVSFLVGTLGAGIASAVIKKRFDTELAVWRSQREWKEQAVSELLGPIYLQFARTLRAFKRWEGKNPYLEASVIRSGNLAIRDLLLEKPNLIPPELRDDASALVVHYDVWLEEFDRWRGDATAAAGAGDEPAQVFAGPQGFGFPRQAEAKFKNVFEGYWRDLYGVESVQPERQR